MRDDVGGRYNHCGFSAQYLCLVLYVNRTLYSIS
jgi:hypothetical protein